MESRDDKDGTPSGGANEQSSHESGEASRERRVREAIIYGLSIVSAFSTFIAGFGILPSTTVTEKTLIFLTALGLSGAIIFGIGAWHNIHRFMLMATCVGSAFVFLVILSVVTQQQSVSVPQAQSTITPVPSYSGELTSGKPESSPITSGPADSSPTATVAPPSNSLRASSASHPSSQTTKTLAWRGQIRIESGAPTAFTDVSQPSLAPNPPAPFDTSDGTKDEDIWATPDSATTVEIYANDSNPDTYMIQWDSGGTPGFTQCQSAAQAGATFITMNLGGIFCFIAPNNTVGEFKVLALNENGQVTLVSGTIWWPQGTS